MSPACRCSVGIFAAIASGCGDDAKSGNHLTPDTATDSDLAADITADATPDIAAPGFELTLAPSAVTIFQGGQAAVALTLHRDAGFEELAAIEVDGLPEGVTARFGANPAATSSTLTLIVAETAPLPPGAVALEVVATSAGQRRTALLGLTIAPNAIDVSGRVVDQHSKPIEGAEVEIAGNIVMTAADGAFAFAQVHRPYDLRVAMVLTYTPVAERPPRTDHASVIYRGVTRPDPVAMVSLPEGAPPDPPAETPRQAELQPTLPFDAATAAQYQIFALVFGKGLITSSTNPFHDTARPVLSVKWQGDETAHGTLYVWVMDPTGRIILAASRELDLVSSRVAVHIPFGDEARIAGGDVVVIDTTVPDGLWFGPSIVVTYTPDPELHGDGAYGDPGYSDLGTTARVEFPPFPKGVAWAAAATQSQDGPVTVNSGRLDPSTVHEVALTVPYCVRLDTPAADSANVTSTDALRWHPIAGTLSFIGLNAERPSGDGTDGISVVTNGDEVQLSWLIEHGFSPRPHTQYHWGIESLGPLASVDAQLGPERIPLPPAYAMIPGAGIVASSTGRTFTTADSP